MEVKLLRTIYLLRHGQNQAGSGHPLGGELTPLGRRQATLAAERIAQLPIDRIVASTLHRAAQTAEIVSARLPGVPVEGTEETWECINVLPTPFETDPQQKQAQIDADQARCDRLCERYFDQPKGETVLLICHGNLIRYLLCRVLGLPNEAFVRFDINNCGLSRVDWKTILGRQITGVNDVGHLANTPDLLTFL